jgi:pilus assembly protein Flp/PilA
MPSVFVTLQIYLARLLRRDDRGATAVEYALMAALIAAVIVVAVAAVGARVTTMFTNLANAF